MSRFSGCGANALAIISLALVPACHRSDASTSRANEGRAAPSAVDAPIQITDSEIREAIAAEFHKDKKIDDAGIRVDVKDGLVALDGRLDNLLSKARSARIAEAIRGVRSVSNGILTSPPPRSDAALLRDVQKALRYNAATATIPIHAEVRGGVVTLTGTVGSWQEQQLVERVAGGVRGVCFVLNAVGHNPSPKREPNAIADEVTRRLAWDLLVERDAIAVVVGGSRVTLSGVVGSAAEKSRAVADAWVDGVRNVEADAVVVQTWHRPRNELSIAKRSDHDTADAINSALSYDPRVSSANINVVVADGGCSLAGAVETVKARLAAEAVTRNVLGVTFIKNNLMVLPRKVLPDRDLAAHVSDALLFDPMLQAHEIVVTVKDGQIRLTGSVATFFESAEAFDVASRVTGAIQVDNELKVKEPGVPYVYSAYLDPFTPYVEAWHAASPRAAEVDSNIARHVRAEFNRSPFINPQHVNVAVLGGKVTLTGMVGTLRERRAAAQNALEAGAVAVDNQLKIG